MIASALRLQTLAPQFFASLNRRISELSSAGYDVIRLDVGSPDMSPPAHIVHALATSAARADRHGYQSHNATPRLREAWSVAYDRLYGVKLAADHQVLPLMGSKEGIFHLSLGVVNPGDVVLAPDPGYMTYAQGARLSGGKVYPVALKREHGYLPDLASIPAEVLKRARILWLNYPNNPTGAVAQSKFFEQAVDFAARHKLLVCHDAAYAQVSFDGYVAPSILQVSGAEQVAVEFNTLSKSHNMAGWRVGAALGNAEALRSLFVVKSNADSGHFLPILEAAEVALCSDQSWIQDRNMIYQNRRDRVVSALRDLGWQIDAPKAGLYIWLPAPTGWGSAEFVQQLLEAVQVALTPGDVFGEQGKGYLRIAITAPQNRLDEAMQRLADFVREKG
jgi:LL-diaminopimelate aminotransferase